MEKAVITYNKDGNEEETITYTWDGNSGEWLKSRGFRFECVFNNSGNLTLNYCWKLGEDKESWIGDWKGEYNYDSDGKQINYIHY